MPLVMQKRETFDPGIAIVSSGFAMINGPKFSVKKSKRFKGLFFLEFEKRSSLIATSFHIMRKLTCMYWLDLSVLN